MLKNSIHSIQKLMNGPSVTGLLGPGHTEAMCFFFYVSRHFFLTKPTRARGKKTKYPKKKKHWLSVPDYLTDKWHTELVVLSAVILLFIFLPNNDRVKQLPVATKVWLFLVLDLSSQAKNVLESSTQTFINIANAFVLQRSLDGKLDWSLDSRPNTYPDVLAKQDLISISRVYVQWFQQKGSWILVFSD